MPLFLLPKKQVYFILRLKNLLFTTRYSSRHYSDWKKYKNLLWKNYENKLCGIMASFTLYIEKKNSHISTENQVKTVKPNLDEMKER